MNYPDFLKKILFMVVAMLFPIGTVASQLESYDFFYHVKTYGNEINSIYRVPSTGIVWMATSQGLMRYGDNPLNHHGNDTYPEGLNCSLKLIEEIGDGRLLILTSGLLYKIYDPVSNIISTDDFTEYLSSWGITGFVPHAYCVTVNNGTFWMYQDNLLYSHPVGTGGQAFLRAKTDDKIKCIYISDTHYYILTSKSLSQYDKKTSRLLCKVKWNYPTDVRNPFMKEDGKGNIWIGNENLYLYDLKNDICHVMYENLSVTDMAVSCDGNIYVATNTRGLATYDYDSDIIKFVSFDAGNINKLKSNRLKSISIDCDNNLWVSYSKQDMSVSNISLNLCGINHVKSLKSKNKKDDISSLLYDLKGHLWLGTDGDGLFDASDSSAKSVIPSKYFSGIDSENSIVSIYYDSAGRLWVGIYRRGLLCKDDRGWNLYLQGTSPFGIVEDMYGNIYVGTMGNGLYMVAPCDNFSVTPIDIDNRRYITCLNCNRTGTVYAATSGGIGLIEASNHNVEMLKGNRSRSQKFTNTDIQLLYTDSRGLIWVVGAEIAGSVDVLDLKSDTLLKVGIHPSARINSLIEDDNKNIWIASDKGIINIVVGYDILNDTYNFRDYIYNLRSNEDEFRHFNYRAVTKTPDGDIMFGSTNGYLIVKPSSYATFQTSIPHKVNLASLEINNQLIRPGEEYNGRVILHHDIASTGFIKLKSGENNLSFAVNTQDFATPFKTEYLYCLKGLSDSWIPIDNHNIDLTNLPVGNYTLSICAKNPDGTYTESLASVEIRIDAPWYLTVWAYVIYGIIAVVAISMIIYYFSERKNQNLLLQQAEKEMKRQQQLNELKLRFFTNISHDFRTPLTLIITPLESYLNDRRKNPDVSFFTPIYKNAVRLLNLINQILDFRKLEVYGEKLNLSGGDVVKFVKEVCESFTMFADNNDIELKFSSSVPTLNMMFDMDKLSKIMMNLLSNAFKHTPHGGKVFVSISTVDKSEELNICVSDYGSGIPDDQKDKIFERFYQNKCDNSANMGCGIGLHIVNEYVKLHNGSISITDNVPMGAVFTVTLPVIHADAGQHVVSETPVVEDLQPHEEREDHESPSTVLLVEDNEEFLDFLIQSLSDDYNILRASNGVDALHILNRTSVDIVVSDVMMDQMGGLELCRRVKENIDFSHIPVILLTAKSMVDDEIMGFEVGADDYITKPFNLSVLKLRIHNILKSRDIYRRNFKNKIDVSPSEITVTSLDEKFISQAISIVEENIANTEFSVEDLSKAMGVHRGHLHRKLTAITGKSPIEFIRLIRLKRARQYLEKSQLYISEIAYSVGFNSPKLFAKYFKEEFGMTPREYQSQYK